MGDEGGDCELDDAPAAVAGREGEEGVGGAIGGHRASVRVQKGAEEHVLGASAEVPGLDAQGRARVAAGSAVIAIVFKGTTWPESFVQRLGELLKEQAWKVGLFIDLANWAPEIFTLAMSKVRVLACRWILHSGQFSLNFR